MEPADVPSLVPDDPDDDHVIACAVEGKADRLVTGDHHLLKLGMCGDIPIISSDEYLKSVGDK